MNYIIWKGVNSNTIPGLIIQELPPISKPPMRYSSIEVDGRDGDITEELGYGSYDKTLFIGLTKNANIDQVIKYFSGEGDLVLSNESNKYYKAKILEQIDYERLVRFRTANVIFHTQPYKKLLNETPIEREKSIINTTGTNINITDAENTNVVEDKMSKLSTQETTTGSQLFNAYAINMTGINVTNDGATITMPIVSTGSGYKTTKKLSVLCPSLQVGDNVYIYFTCTSANNKTLYTTDGTYWANGGYKTITQNMLDATFVLYSNNANQGETEANVYSNLRIVKTQNAPFEKYTGETPSPNPDYPQEVKTVKGYRNLFDLKSFITNAGETYTENSDGSITFHTASAMYSNFVLFSETDVNISISALITNITTSSFRIELLNSSNNVVAQINRLTTKIENVSANKIRFNWSTAGDVTIKELMLNKGSTILPYVPYGTNWIYKKIIGKNLFDESQLLKATNWTKNNDGYYNGTLANFHIAFCQGFNIPVVFETNTQYTISFNGYVSGGNAVIKIDYTDDTYSILRISNTTASNLSLTSTANKTISRIDGSYGAGSSQVLYLKNIQVEKGATATTYEQYKETIVTIPLNNNEICGIGNYKDELIVDKNGHCWLNKKINKVVLDGSESGWGVSNTGTANWYYYKTYTTNIAPGSVGLSNYYSSANIANNTTLQGFIITSGYFRIRYGTEDTITNYKSWLSTHNLIIYYPLATSELIDLQHNVDLTLFEGTNTITNGEDMDMEIKYIQNNKATINNIGNTYSSPILDIKGTGTIGVYLNSSQIFSIDLSEENEIIIDTDKLEAYNPITNQLMNRKVIGDYEDFKLLVGENIVKFTGNLESATITNYTRWL